MGENSKQVRVDNWGVFFLQRLQMFFSKTDYCDLTLQFEGNVQLKVHRLVMNACTEYFEFLERTCPSLEENVILMPTNLQADVIVPIVNFIYTGMLEFNMSIFDKLYKAADLMSINVLTKLLDAQKHTSIRKKNSWPYQEKKVLNKQLTPQHKDLPATLPGRKLPVWKRKVVPVSNSLGSPFSESKWNVPQDPLSIPDNTPKPTRFEWPDEDLPTLGLMDSSFDDISYTSRPLLTQAEEIRASTSFDTVKNSTVQNSRSGSNHKKDNSSSLDMEDMKDYIKEQKIRTDMETFENEIHNDSFEAVTQKRKQDLQTKASPKRIKIEKENKETTINISSKGAELDHTKIVSEILKKYPHLVKKNKNIRLKIVATGNKSGESKITTNQNINIKVQESMKKSPLTDKTRVVEIGSNKVKEGQLWSCKICEEVGQQVEFQLFYMYRKHMIDIHSEQFDTNLCKYCGQKCSQQNTMMYHLYTKHGVRTPKSSSFPKCNQCPYIAISNITLAKHKQLHSKNDIQCGDCQLAFSSAQSFTRHVQITGHTTKEKKRESFDCQFCTKKIMTALNLFAHIREQHLTEARRDGVVIVEDIDEDDIKQEQESLLEDYIVPTEMIRESQTDKVKIISNVKVPMGQESSLEEEGGSINQRGTPLEPSSEAEALSNVASGIATSLGLVDIVVLDENQQYILQQQQAQSGQQEFILPDLASGESPFGHQVITTQHSGVLPQAMLQTASGSDIGSTDELVMVLTDHDYQDGHEGANVDNSNIVVLYSHPVDGQQGQFITSQGNLMVNSQMGLLEIRNGSTIATTTSSQLIRSDAPIESIEMIQREIEGHSEISKDGGYYEQECKTQEEEEHHQQEQEEHHQQEEPHQQEQGQSTTSADEVQHAEEQPTEIQEPHLFTDNIERDALPEEANDTDDDKFSEVLEVDTTDGRNQCPAECEPMDVDQADQDSSVNVVEEDKCDDSQPELDLQAKDASEEYQEADKSVEPAIVEETAEEEHGVDVIPDMARDKIPEDSEISQPLDEVKQQDQEVYVTNQTGEEYVPEAMEVDGRCANEAETAKEQLEESEPGDAKLFDESLTKPQELEENQDIEEKQSEHGEESTLPDAVEEKTEKPTEESREIIQEESQGINAEHELDEHVESAETNKEETEPYGEQEVEMQSQSATDSQHAHSETSNSQFNDDNSQSWQDSQDDSTNTAEVAKPDSQISVNSQLSTKISILDDWEDTDSQQSEKQRTAMKVAEERVNKLMDDWDEEDEDDGQKKSVVTD